MRDKPADSDQVMARIAARQHGVIASNQLQEAGLSRDAVVRRVQRGRLHRLHRGVYAVGHPNISIEGRYMAAVLACGEGAVLSHRSAAEHWKLLPVRAGPVHVTVPDRGSRARRQGIQLHRSSVLPFQDLTRHRGVPVTSVGRTLTDLRRESPEAVARKAARQAAVLGLNTGTEGEIDRTRSELERRFLWLCRRHRLPPPDVNVRVNGFLVDFLWREAKVIVETDGWQFHRGKAAFDDDRTREARLRLAGFDVLRFSYRQVFEDPGEVVAVVGRAIASSTALLSRYPRQTRRGGA